MPKKLLNEETDNQVRQLFDSELVDPGELLVFLNDGNYETCEDVRQLLEELTDTSDKLHFSTYDLERNTQLAQQYHVELTPGLVIAGREGDEVLDFGIRFNGIPAGYEFGSLIQDILHISKRNAGLHPETREKLKCLKKLVQPKVFVTST